MTIRRALSGLLVAALAGAAATVALPSSPVRAAGKNLQVMTWNVCDSRRASWHCDGTGTSRQKVDVIKWHVANSYVRAALLQEVCEDSLALLVAELGSAWSARFVPYRWSQDGALADSPCDAVPTGNRIGTAIVVRAGLSAGVTYPTTQPWTGLQRPFQCVTATYWAVRLCNAHLTPAGGNPDHPSWEYADDQLTEIRTTVAGFPDVVLGGDLNVEPASTPGNARAWLWPPGGMGYPECDAQARSTHDGGWKIDYLFSSETRRWCGLGASAYSDHRVMIESVEVVS